MTSRTAPLAGIRHQSAYVRLTVTNQPEDMRLNRLRTYRVLDTEPAAAYDALARLAASVCATPIALIALVDETRVWFKAKVGLERFSEVPRAGAFCNETIRGAGILEVADAREDERFASNPLVAGAPALRFYAGAPLLTPDGSALGALCVGDRRVRCLTPSQREQLQLLAQLVVDELERRNLLLRLAEGFANVARTAARDLVEDLGEAFGIEFRETEASSDDQASSTIGGRVTRPSRRAQQQLRVLLLSGGESAGFAEQLRSIGFTVSASATASELRRAAVDTDVVVLPVALGTWAGIDRLPDELRRRIGLVALTTGEVLGTQRWDATVAAPAVPAELRAAIYAAAAKARIRRAEDGGPLAKG